MSESNLTLDFDALKTSVAFFLGLGPVDELAESDEENVEEIVQTGYRRFITPPPTSDRPFAHEWSFLSPRAILMTNAPYSTGTVAVVNGVVTLTGGTFPSWAISGEIVIASDDFPSVPVQVSVRTDDTHITLANTAVNVIAGATYVLYRVTYSFPDSYAGLYYQEFVHRAGSVSLTRIPVKSDVQLRHRVADSFAVGVPTMAALRPSQFTNGTRWDVAFYPYPNDEYALEYRYNINPDSFAEYPLGGMRYSEVLRESCLAYAEEKMHDDSRLHREKFDEQLRAAIQLDERMSSVDSLGMDAERAFARRPWERGTLRQSYPVNITLNF